MVGTRDAQPAGADATWHTAFVPGSVAHRGRFVWWNVEPTTLFDLDTTPPIGPVDTDGEHLALSVRTAIEKATRNPVSVVVDSPTGTLEPIAGALDLASASSALPLLAATGVSPSVRAWAAAVRSGLGLIASGRVHPTVDANGFDTWRIDRLRPAELATLKAHAASIPWEGICVRSPTSEPQYRSPQHLVRSMWDALADALARSAAGERLSRSHLYASFQPTKVPHLRPWAAGRGERVPVEVTLDANDAGTWTIRLTHGTPGLAELRSLGHAARVWPALANLAESPTEPLPLGDNEVGQYLDHAEEIGDRGVVVHWDSETLIDDAIISLAPAGGSFADSLGETGLETVLHTRWTISLEGEPLSGTEFEQLVQSTRPLVRLRGRWVRISAEQRRTLASPAPSLGAGEAFGAVLADDDAQNTLALAGADANAAAATATRTWKHFAQLAAELAQRTTNPTDDDKDGFQPPTGLTATLRPYQRRGVRWLNRIVDSGLGGILADDMGLGKTVQLIAAHRHALQRRATARTGGATLVVCPTSLVSNWSAELARFSPATTVITYHGSSRSALDAVVTRAAADTVVITTYGTLRTSATVLGQQRWDLVIADEAQAIKNHRSATSRALRSIPARSRIAVTGTPVENRLLDLWSLFAWAVPGLMGTETSFRTHIGLPIERDGSSAARQHLTRLISPFLLRRTKSEPGVADDLPPKIETTHLVRPSREQAAMYRAVAEEHLAKVESRTGIDRRGAVLALLTDLKKVTNHPVHYVGDDSALDGRSGKLAAAERILRGVAGEGRSALVFTQYVEMAMLLRRRFGEMGIGSEVFHGGLRRQTRADLIDRFQAGDVAVLVISLKAGGAGLNLTRATDVIHYDRWWNPAVENQATDRAHRIGQRKTVTVHRLITQGTLEERIAELLEAKQALAGVVDTAGEGWITEMSDSELGDLVRLSEPDDEDAPDDVADARVVVAGR